MSSEPFFRSLLLLLHEVQRNTPLTNPNPVDYWKLLFPLFTLLALADVT